MTENEVITFTSKGQLVIPSRLRKAYHIEAGTKAVVVETPEGILLRPVTKWSIDRGFGLLRAKPSAKGGAGNLFKEEWADHKRSERALEERR